MNAARWLNFHSSYACKDVGACCSSGWPIPVEQDRLTAIETAVDAGRLRPVNLVSGRWQQPADASVGRPAILEVSNTCCVFLDEGSEKHCRIHRTLGHEALPLACRQFPRVSLTDPRGVSVTLSHYCPTAAAMLEDGEPVHIQEVSANAEYVGLDVRNSLPPLLRPDMLMDWDSWWLWEARAVAVLSDPASSLDEALARVRGTVEHVRRWSPGNGPLASAVDAAWRSAPSSGPYPLIDARMSEILQAIPAAHKPPSTLVPADRPHERESRRLLAAHAFANWTAHLGQGLRTWFRSIETVATLVESGYGVRQIDLLIRHLADPHELAKTWSNAERN